MLQCAGKFQEKPDCCSEMIMFSVALRMEPKMSTVNSLLQSPRGEVGMAGPGVMQKKGPIFH